MMITKDVFFKIQSEMDYISYDQAIGYHDFIGENKIIYFTDHVDHPTICAWGVIEKKFKILSILRITGESFKDAVSSKNYKDFYSQILEVTSNYSIVSIINNNQYSTDYEVGIRLAGFIRPMVFSDSPLSILVDLNKEDIRKRQWKRQLKEANRNGLSFVYVEKPGKQEIDIFVKMYYELSQRKGLGSHITAINIRRLLQDQKYFLFFVLKDDEYLAGRIVYINNDKSYDVYAANSNNTQAYKGTTYFMMESIFDFLKTQGVNEFDFGRIGIGKRSSNGVYEFKTYSGGDVINYNSSWVFCRSKNIDTLFSVFRNFRTNRY